MGPAHISPEPAGAGLVLGQQRHRRVIGPDEALCILAQHFGHANEGIEWSAELMAHVGEELRLVLACFRDLAALVLDIVEQPHVAPALMSSKIRCGRALLRPSPLCARGTTTQQIGWLYIS